jgi:hypothetical protein
MKDLARLDGFGGMPDPRHFMSGERAKPQSVICQPDLSGSKMRGELSGGAFSAGNLLRLLTAGCGTQCECRHVRYSAGLGGLAEVARTLQERQIHPERTLTLLLRRIGRPPENAYP